jgi:hypothetical protein
MTGNKHLWNVGKLLSDYTALQPKDSHLHTRSRENLKLCHMQEFSSPECDGWNPFKQQVWLWRLSPYDVITVTNWICKWNLIAVLCMTRGHTWTSSVGGRLQGAEGFRPINIWDTHLFSSVIKLQVIAQLKSCALRSRVYTQRPLCKHEASGCALPQSTVRFKSHCQQHKHARRRNEVWWLVEYTAGR